MLILYYADLNDYYLAQVSIRTHFSYTIFISSYSILGILEETDASMPLRLSFFLLDLFGEGLSSKKWRSCSVWLGNEGNIRVIWP